MSILAEQKGFHAQFSEFLTSTESLKAKSARFLTKVNFYGSANRNISKFDFEFAFLTCSNVNYFLFIKKIAKNTLVKK